MAVQHDREVLCHMSVLQVRAAKTYPDISQDIFGHMTIMQLAVLVMLMRLEGERPPPVFQKKVILSPEPELCQ